MTTRTTVTAVCDFPDDTPGDQHGEARTIGFALDDHGYEAEFCATAELAFVRDLGPFIDAARLVRDGRATQAKRPIAGRRRSAAIRAWAIRQGLQVGDRGRLSAEVVAKYDAEHGGQRP